MEKRGGKAVSEALQMWLPTPPTIVQFVESIHAEGLVEALSH